MFYPICPHLIPPPRCGGGGIGCVDWKHKKIQGGLYSVTLSGRILLTMYQIIYTHIITQIIIFGKKIVTHSFQILYT
jgi:hypothetical protein